MDDARFIAACAIVLSVDMAGSRPTPCNVFVVVTDADAVAGGPLAWCCAFFANAIDAGADNVEDAAAELVAVVAQLTGAAALIESS